MQFYREGLPMRAESKQVSNCYFVDGTLAFGKQKAESIWTRMSRDGKYKFVQVPDPETRGQKVTFEKEGAVVGSQRNSQMSK
mmetsp:Transcript_15472/g.11261  ORF Transcript_15472/g.11261 Transcript_15472/m.11261 type:complete len:82 (-) Transcript_15472:333-578(-)